MCQWCALGLFLTVFSLIFTFTLDMRSDCFWLLCLRCALLCFWMLRQTCVLSFFWLLRQWCVLPLLLWCALSLFVLNCCISDAHGLWSDTRNCCFPLQCRGSLRTKSQFLSSSEALLFVLKGQSSSPVTNNSRHE